MTKLWFVFRNITNAPTDTTQYITKYSALRSCNLADSNLKWFKHRQVKHRYNNCTSEVRIYFFLACHFYNNTILHSMKTVATFPLLLPLLLVKPVCLSPRPFSFSPLSQHSLLQFMSLSLPCSYSVLHFSPLIKHEKRPYWFISKWEILHKIHVWSFILQQRIRMFFHIYV